MRHPSMHLKAVIISLLLVRAFGDQVAADASTIINSTAVCSDKHFDCGYGSNRCIPIQWKCDNMFDCENESDETGCSRSHDCGDKMLCKSGGACIDTSFKCDGAYDCPDGDDERYCGDVIKLSDLISPRAAAQAAVNMLPSITHSLHNDVKPCEKPKFKCASGQCLSPTVLCDGSKDCPDGEDESHCTNEGMICPTDKKLCSDMSSCISFSWVCDGVDDCADGSDEHDCPSDTLEERRFEGGKLEVCSLDSFHCDSFGQDVCIPRNKTCDGIRDCPQGDDETPMCNNCKTKQCSHTCEDTPTGGICRCMDGYKLDSDGISCAQIDECVEHGHLCQQYCEDSVGSHKCRCAPGYTLNANGHSCHLERDHEGMLILSLGTEIRSMPLFDASTSSASYSAIHRTNGNREVRSVDYFVEENKLFFAVSGHGGELMMIDGAKKVVLRENATGIEHVAVDWLGRNVYFTQKYPAPQAGITVCSMDGRNCRQIIQGQPGDAGRNERRQSYRGLAVHPLRGLLFWVDSYMSRNRIMVANMDGTNVREFVTSKLDFPVGITVDPIKNDVYFGDAERQMIMRVNLDTKKRHVVFTNGVSYPHDIGYFAGSLYWLDWGSETLKMAHVNEHHASPIVLHTFNRYPHGLAFNHTQYQPAPANNPCTLVDCPYSCVSVPSSVEVGGLEARCICPDNYEQDENGCRPVSIDGTDRPLSTITPPSLIGMALMQEYCREGRVCMNGGRCGDVTNEHGRIERVVCMCDPPYVGEQCEIYDEALSNLVARASSSSWTMVLVLFLLIAVLVAFLYLYFTNRAFNVWLHDMKDRAKDRVAELPSNTNIPDITPYVERLRSKLPGRSADSSFNAAPGNVNATETPMGYSNPLYSETTTSPLQQSHGQQRMGGTASRPAPSSPGNLLDP